MELTDLCKEINNWFDISRYFGRFTIKGGAIDLSEMATDGSIIEGQYFRIAGSVFNDGVYQYPASGLTDEVFEGAVWAMAVPPAVTALYLKIDEWVAAHSKEIDSPYQSESFGGYSYSKSGGGDASGNLTWQGHFKHELDRWRKICPY